MEQIQFQITPLALIFGVLFGLCCGSMLTLLYLLSKGFFAIKIEKEEKEYKKGLDVLASGIVRKY